MRLSLATILLVTLSFIGCEQPENVDFESYTFKSYGSGVLIEDDYEISFFDDGIKNVTITLDTFNIGSSNEMLYVGIEQHESSCEVNTGSYYSPLVQGSYLGHYGFDWASSDDVYEYYLNHELYHQNSRNTDGWVYAGVRLKRENKKLFGWVKFMLNDGELTLISHMVSHLPNGTVYAGEIPSN